MLPATALIQTNRVRERVMDDHTVSPDELLARLPEQRRRRIARRGAQLIAEERARRVARGEPPYPDRSDEPGALDGAQGANDADV